MFYNFIKNYATYKVLICMVLLTTGNIHAQKTDLFLNPNKPVDLSKFEKIYDFWNLVKISFPNAEVKFMCSPGKVDFCVFDLKHENSFIVFSSIPHATSFKLKIDNIESNAFKHCMVQHTDRSGQKIHNSFFGYFFQLEEGKSCEIICEGEYNEGNLTFNVTRDDKSLWLGSVIKEK